MEQKFILDLVRVTEAGALASARLMGRGNEKQADQAAVSAMRTVLNALPCDGTVVIGEGERDEAPMLYIGEKVGTGEGRKFDIALDPLEGTTICARGKENALSVIAIADPGNFLHAPDTYMKKIAVGSAAKGKVDINKSATENLRAIAKAKGCAVADVTAIILNRPRHEDLIQEVRKAGARIRLIDDGDVSAAIAASRPGTGIDVLFGIGGAPEGVLAAAALRCMGGDFQGQLAWRNDEEKTRAKKMGITDLNRVYTIDELARGNVIFAATGVTRGELLDGVKFTPGGAETHSVVMRSETGTVRYVKAYHNFETKPFFPTEEGELSLRK